MPKTTSTKHAKPLIAESAETAPPSRSIERLVALLRYEMEPVRGSSSSEVLERLLEYAQRVVINAECPEQPTRADLDRIHAESVAMAEHVLQGLIANGHAAEAAAFVEGVATSRRECEARFGGERAIPFSRKEREALSKRWDSKHAAYLARSASTEAN